MEASLQEHSTRYQGKNLLRLLVAMGTPAALLDLRLTFGYVASESHLTRVGVERLVWASNCALVLFFVAQLIAARYVQQLIPPVRGAARRALRYIAVLLLCTLFSIIGAVLLEAFGYMFLLRFKTARR